jgi:hypothetical protein
MSLDQGMSLDQSNKWTNLGSPTRSPKVSSRHQQQNPRQIRAPRWNCHHVQVVFGILMKPIFSHGLLKLANQHD